MEEYSPKEVIGTAKSFSNANNEDGIVKLSTGVLVKISSVSASLVEAAQGAVPPPEVPIWHNEVADRDEENPNHPKYLQDLQQWEIQRTLAAVDVMLMFGVTLVDEDGLEVEVDKGRWVQKLKFLEKHNLLDMSDFDLEDSFDREFIYKKYVAIGAPDIQLIAQASSLSEEDVAKATEAFQDNTS